MTDEGIVYRQVVGPCFLGNRNYLHGTTIMTLLLEGLETIFALDELQCCQLNRFRVLREEDRQGEVVIVRGKSKVFIDDSRERIQAEATFTIEQEQYYGYYILNDSPMVCRVAYDETGRIGVREEAAYSLEMAVFNGARWFAFEDWIRTVVAANKTYCQERLGKQEFRWVSLSNVDLLKVYRWISGQECRLEYKPRSFKGGIGGKNYVLHDGRIRAGNDVIDFEICFCY